MKFLTSHKIQMHGIQSANLREYVSGHDYYQCVVRRYYFLGIRVWDKMLAKRVHDNCYALIHGTNRKILKQRKPS